METNITIAVAIAAIISPILTAWVNNKHLDNINQENINQKKVEDELNRRATIQAQWDNWFVDFFGGVYLQMANGAENTKTMLRDKTDLTQAPMDLTQPHIIKMQQAAPFIRYLSVEVNICRRLAGNEPAFFQRLISEVFVDSTTSSANSLLYYLPEFKIALAKLKPTSLLPDYTGKTTSQDYS